ncbi:MAG: hypothetical protein AAGE86_04995 [Pseudomonadota bacterium]
MASNWLKTALGLAAIGLLSGCAPDPIPSGARPDFSLKSGVVWYWQQPVKGGCVDWMAKEEWVYARVQVEAECVERGSADLTEAQGLAYSSSFDEITFYGHWPWSADTFYDLIVFDKDGNWVETKPCPHELAKADLLELRAVVEQARHTATGKGDTKVLDRIERRLAMTDGTGLASSQSGCSHRPDDPSWRDTAARPNPWTGGQ